MAIMEYLNDISGGKLMPVDPKLKAQVYYDLKITQWQNMKCKFSFFVFTVENAKYGSWTENVIIRFIWEI